MLQEVGDEILRKVRFEYRMLKPFNKNYLFSCRQRRLDKALQEKARWRNNLNYLNSMQPGFHGNLDEDRLDLFESRPSYVMAEDAYQMAKDQQYRVCMGAVGDGFHDFCVVDLFQEVDLPETVQEIAPIEGSGSAWVIDPWMNISCNFTEYKQHVLMKTAKWSAHGKYITDGVVLSEHTESEVWGSSLLIRRLRFVDHWEPVVSQERYSRTKGAHRALP